MQKRKRKEGPHGIFEKASEGEVPAEGGKAAGPSAGSAVRKAQAEELLRERKQTPFSRADLDLPHSVCHDSAQRNGIAHGILLGS